MLLGLLAALTLLRLMPYDAQRTVIRTWSKLLLAVLGIRVALRHEAELEDNGLIVANHVSWVDAFVLGSVFGAKKASGKGSVHFAGSFLGFAPIHEAAIASAERAAAAVTG